MHTYHAVMAAVDPLTGQAETIGEAGGFTTATAALSYAANAIGRTVAELEPPAGEPGPHGLMFEAHHGTYTARWVVIGYTLERYIDAETPDAETDGAWSLNGRARQQVAA